MDGKVIAIIAVAAVVVLVGAGAAGFILMKDDNEKSSDYTLLDKTTAEKGLYYEIESTMGDIYTQRSFKISYIHDDGTLDIMTAEKEKSTVTAEMSIHQFSFTFFNLAEDKPTGVEVEEKDVEGGHQYKITGKNTTEDNGLYYKTKVTMEFKDVVFITDPSSKVVSASGEITKDYSKTHVDSPDSLYNKYNLVWKLSTKDDTGMAEKKMDSDEKDISKAYDYNEFRNLFMTYSADTYKACEDKTESARYGGVDCTKHTLNGTTTALEVYKNVDLYVYGNYIIHGEGEVNGLNSTLNVKIYID